MTTSPLLTTRGLTMRFGGVTAVKNVDFNLYSGEVHCLIGPNGAGKSTFFKMLSGLLAPTSGEIRFDGKKISGLARHQISRHGIGIKTQVPSVFPEMSVLQSLTVAARRHPSDSTAATVERMTTMFRLGDILENTVSKLSHGQRQVVEIAMVVATGPQLLLLDEPVAGMSDRETAHLAELLEEMRGKLTMVVVDHDIRFIRRIGEGATVFHRGEVIARGTVGEVLANDMVRDVYLGRSHA